MSAEPASIDSRLRGWTRGLSPAIALLGAMAFLFLSPRDWPAATFAQPSAPA